MISVQGEGEQRSDSSCASVTCPSATKAARTRRAGLGTTVVGKAMNRDCCLAGVCQRTVRIPGCGNAANVTGVVRAGGRGVVLGSEGRGGGCVRGSVLSPSCSPSFSPSQRPPYPSSHREEATRGGIRPFLLQMGCAHSCWGVNVLHGFGKACAWHGKGRVPGLGAGFLVQCMGA